MKVLKEKLPKMFVEEIESLEKLGYAYDKDFSFEIEDQYPGFCMYFAYLFKLTNKKETFKLDLQTSDYELPEDERSNLFKKSKTEGAETKF